EGLQKRALDQEFGPEDVVSLGAVDLATGLQQADLEHLAGIVPLVDRGVDVQPLVALEANQTRAEGRGEDLCQFRLADAGLALEQQRPAKLESQEDGCREGPIADVVVASKVPLELLDGARARCVG